MYIANPIYDVVFKYLMEDSKLAKLMISSIIGEEIVQLKLVPQEFLGEFEDIKGQKPKRKLTQRFGLTVYRIDFSAKIKTKEGYKQVLIELQKAKFPTDIMRFRKYLGHQFSNKENTQRVIINGKARKVGLPLISIYFLGHSLDYTKASGVKVSREYRDLITNEIIHTKEHFIESLTLDSYIIQIPSLSLQRRTDLEILLSVFDQSTAVDSEHHILNMNEQDFPAKFRPIIRKLHQAVQTQEIKTQMELEDGVIEELEEMERQIEELAEKNTLAQKQKAQVEQEKAQVEQEKAQVEQEKAQVEQEKAQVEQEKAQVEQEKAQVEQEKVQVEQKNAQLEQENQDTKIQLAAMQAEIARWKTIIDELKNKG